MSSWARQPRADHPCLSLLFQRFFPAEAGRPAFSQCRQQEHGPMASSTTATATTNNYPRLHNAMWPGLVGKGSPGAEPFIDLDTMLDLTAKADVGGVKFDGVDIF